MKKRSLLYLLLFALSSNTLFSQSPDRWWDDEANDNEWTSPLNWSHDALPEFNADVHINNNHNVNISTGNHIIIESVALGADGSIPPILGEGPPVMYPNTSGSLTIAEGAILTLEKGGHEGSKGLRIEGVSGNESILVVNGTLNIISDANGDGLDINQYTSVHVGTTGVMNINADRGDGIELSDDLYNSGSITITGVANCDEGIGFSGVVAGGAVIENYEDASITINGNGFIENGLNLNSQVIFNNHGTLTISGVQQYLMTNSFQFNNYGTFKGNGIMNADNFNAGGSGSVISPGTLSQPIGKFIFLKSVDLSDVELHIDINSASSYDQIEALVGSINISNAVLNLSGAYVPAPGDELMIIDNDTPNPIIGEFFDLPQDGIVLFNGVPLIVDYEGGTNNNDLVLYVQQPLPVELISFKGIAKERSNLLEWQTASEENAMVFIVERSAGSVSDFEEIGRVDAAGFSTTLNHYRLEDFNPVALAYYRLRIVDYDGTFEFSDIIVIERSEKDKKLVEVFPVPAIDEVTVLIHAENNRKAIMTLSDFTGKKIREENVYLQSGINHFNIDLNADEDDTNFFFLTIDDGKEVTVKKILRIKE